MRNVKTLFSLPKDQLTSKEQLLLTTFNVVAQKMKEYL
jgi:hypothetical protein